jgi:hypothetical protein
MQREPIERLVHELPIAPYSKPDEIERRGRNSGNDCAIRGIVPGREHSIGVDGQLQATLVPAGACARQRRPDAREHEHGLSEQRVVRDAARVVVGFADQPGMRSGQTARQERRYIELLPHREVIRQGHGDLGIELHATSIRRRARILYD